MHLKLPKTLINDRSTKNIIYFAQGCQNKKFYHSICNDRKTFLTDVAWITFRRLSFAFSHLKVKPQILFIIERTTRRRRRRRRERKRIDSRLVLDRDDRTRKWQDKTNKNRSQLMSFRSRRTSMRTSGGKTNDSMAHHISIDKTI